MKVLKLFENCSITRGFSRSALVDMQRDKVFLLPNSLEGLFDDHHVLKVGDVDGTEELEVLEEYVAFLLQNELCFYCEEAISCNFPVIEIKQWDYPATITNAVVEFAWEKREQYFAIVKELTERFLTRHIEVHLVGSTSIEILKSILDQLDELDLYSYNIIFSTNHAAELTIAIDILKFHHKVFRTIIYDCAEEQVHESNRGTWGNIFLLKNKFTFSECGKVNSSYFCKSIEHVSESQKHNSCLNRKISIDVNGNIKNCPSMVKSFGNIDNVQLIDVVNNQEFQKMWYIHKDQIKVCKDCEFRHICTDCRAYLEDPDDLYSKPLKCGYNPYTCKWEEWSTNPLKQKAIEYYGFREIVKDTNTAS